MNKKDDRQLAIQNLEKLEKENLIDRRDFLSLSALAASTTLFTNFLTMESSFAWVATRMRRGKSSNASNIDVGDIANSLRFRSSAGSYLTRTFTGGNTQKWTFSFWYKPAALGAYSYVLTAGSSATYYGVISFACSGFIDGNDTLKIYQVWNNSAASPNYTLYSSAIFRDPTAWYHVVISSDVSVSNGIKAYVNGIEITLTGTQPTAGGWPSWFNSNVSHTIGKNQAFATTTMDAYLARVCLVDGQALTPTSFGYLNPYSNAWVTKSQSAVKAVVDAGGSNSFMLDFDNNTSTATLGNDKSSKGNNWTTANFSLTAGTTYDWMLDTPSNNYCVMNVIGKTGTVSIIDGNLGNSFGSSSSDTIISSVAIINKAYAEFYGVAFSSAVRFVGIGESGTSVNSVQYYSDGRLYINNVSQGVPTYSSGDLISIDCDPITRQVRVYKNNSQIGSTGTINGSESLFFIAGGSSAGTGNSTGGINFGQRPFTYTPASGFKALCTKNLPSPSIVNAKKHFDIGLYTGNAAARSIATDGSGNNLQLAPNLVWAKARTGAANNHVLFDTVRGVGNYLMSSSTSAEVYNATMLTAFNSNGFSVSTDSTTAINGNGLQIVSWLWKAGGAGVANNTGNIASTVSANTTSGFSIVTWTGNGAASSGVTIGHGLGKKPDFIMVKKRSSGTTDYGWSCWHKDLGGNYGIWLHVTNARNPAMWAGYTNHNTTVFSPPDLLYSNENGHTYVTYCFTEVSGFSKIGSYTGNGSADGPFVYCGFKPRWVMIKSSSNTEDWRIIDTARSTYNIQGATLYPNTTSSENAAQLVDINSNGFKIRTTDAAVNGNGWTYIYVAFAEVPFKYANAR